MLSTTAIQDNSDSTFLPFRIESLDATIANFLHSIIRILFMIPIYSATSFLCICFYRESVYHELIGNCYEPFAIASFFTLLCQYIAPDVHSQKEYFGHIEPKNWL